MKSVHQNGHMSCSNRATSRRSAANRALPVLACGFVLVIGARATNAAGGNSDALYQVVVQGIRENCRKLECGVLTWQAEFDQSTRGTDEYRQERKSGQMWQQGEKVAVRVTWQDTHGNATTKREGTETTAVNVYDGKEYRGVLLGGTHMVLDKEPHYNRYANYLNDCGWPGYAKSIVNELEKSQSDELVETTWSVVEVDGAERIKLRKRWIGPAFPDIYKDFYFDPTKGCMLAQTEFYRNEKLEGTSTWRLEEVLEGMWFPVEGTGRSIVSVDGQVYDAELRLAIDPKKSSFNDRSAIPEGTFKLEITDDIKTIADHRAGDPPLIIDRREVDRLTDAELGNAVKEFFGNDPSADSSELVASEPPSIRDVRELESEPNNSTDESSDLVAVLAQGSESRTPSAMILMWAGGGVAALGLAAWGIRRWRMRKA